jgi:hypothetical protein
MKLLKWVRQFFSPESEAAEPFPDLVKEKTSEVVVKPPRKPRKPADKSTKKSTGGKKNG